MYRRVMASIPDECFLPISKRRQSGTFFFRVTQYSNEIGEWLWKYHEAARQKGVILENQIQNPDERQLNYYMETMGTAFSPEGSFIRSALQKWMPRMNESVRAEFAEALYAQLQELRHQGKSEGIQKNVYIKLMCWLYYKFERLMPYLGQDDAPKILYESSSITNHELILLRLLMSMGTDIVLLETQSDEAYQKLDAASAYSQILSLSGGKPFPADFSLKKFRKEHMSPRVQASPSSQSRATPSRPAAVPGGNAGTTIDVEKRLAIPSKAPCTNAWMKKADWQEARTPPVMRGTDTALFYNVFLRVNGVQDKLTYVNELYQFYQQMQTEGRKVCIMDGALPLPSSEEIQKIRRRNYRSAEEMTLDLVGNIPAAASVDLQRMMQLSFARTMKQAQLWEPNVNRLMTTAVYLLCWIQRYQNGIFQGWRDGDVPCVVKMGGCGSEREALYMLYLSQLPVDVIIFAPNLNQPCVLRSDRLLDITGTESMAVMAFPRQNGNLTMHTAASYAEGELSSVLYEDTGLYRNQQFARAAAITLQTTYDEIFILWDQELKYRPNFSAGSQGVNMPVLYAKISGVEEGKLAPYWQKVKSLVSTADTLLFRQFPIAQGGGSSFGQLAAKCLKEGRIRSAELKANRQYPFGLLRVEMQEHILHKTQEMLDERLIRGTFENGTEYTVLSTILGMRKEILRLIQGFDFTKKNPKIVVVSTKEEMPAKLEDAILLAFLNRIGFDIAMFVPTGYQTIEPYLKDCLPIEHQIGAFIYDQEIPDFAALPEHRGLQRLNQFLRRGN